MLTPNENTILGALGRGMSDFRQSLSAEEKDKLRALLLALKPFQAIRPTMPLQYVVAFLLVALDEGEGVTTYANRAGVSQSVMSRHLLDIGDRNRHKEEGFGLITQRQTASCTTASDRYKAYAAQWEHDDDAVCRASGAGSYEACRERLTRYRTSALGSNLNVTMQRR